MKYNVEFFKHGKFLNEQSVTAPGKAEYKSDYCEGKTYGAAVEVKSSEEAHVRFWAGKIYNENVIELSEGRGSAYWASEFKVGLEVVVRPCGT